MRCTHKNAVQKTVSWCLGDSELNCCDDDVQTILICPNCGCIKAINYTLCETCCSGNSSVESWWANAQANWVVPENFAKSDPNYTSVATKGVVPQLTGGSAPNVKIKYNNNWNSIWDLCYPVGSISYNSDIASLVGGTWTYKKTTDYWIKGQIPAGTGYTPVSMPNISGLPLTVTTGDTNNVYFTPRGNGWTINTLTCNYLYYGYIFISSVSGSRSHGQFYLCRNIDESHTKMNDLNCLGGVDSSVGNIGSNWRCVNLNGITSPPSDSVNTEFLVLQSTNTTTQSRIAISGMSTLICRPLIPGSYYERVA